MERASIGGPEVMTPALLVESLAPELSYAEHRLSGSGVAMGFWAALGSS